MTAIVKLLGGWRATLFAALAVAAVVGLLFQRASLADSRADREAARAEAAEGRVEQLQAVVKTERARASRANAIADQYERDKRDAEFDARRLVADLRNGRKRLQERWTCPGVPAANAGASEPDAAVGSRAESAGRIIAAADECDAQVRGLQEFIRSERQGVIK